MPLRARRGLPGSKVIPDGWTAHHAPAVATTFDSQVAIGPAGGTPAFNPATRRSETPALTAVYTGPASISHPSATGVGDGTRLEAADDEIDERTYEVKLPAGDTSTIEADHVVLVVSCPNPRLVGARLIVQSLPAPGREFSRTLIARLFE